MKKHAILTTLILLGLFFTACTKDENVTPSNNVTTVKKTITGYSQLNISEPFQVFVTFSETENLIQIEANTNLQQYINVEKYNDQLIINIDDDVNISGSNVVLKAYITTNQLDTFYGSGTTAIQLENELIGNNLVVELSGASSFTGTVHVNQFNSELTGASGLYLEGSCGYFNIEANGASNMEGYGFSTDKLMADLEGASNIYLTIYQELDVSATDASNVYYKGDGVIVNHDLSGGSQIIKMD
jgi:hypothetical protein